jgi:LacI family transcriptional regulator
MIDLGPKRRSKGVQTRAVPTVKQVAQRAGVSTATVSRVLSGAPYVGGGLNRRVMEATRELGFQLNRTARNLRTRASRAVGIVIPDIENPFFGRVVCGIEEVLQAAGYSLLLSHSNENPNREQINLRTFRAEGVAGIIFTSSFTDMSDYEQLSKMGMPLVAVSRILPGFKVDMVTVTNSEGAHAAVSHLIALGHKRIGMINGPAWISTSRERLLGYEQALGAAGLPVPQDLVQHTDWRQAGGYHAMQTLLQKAPPTAVFVGSNLLTLGALQRIHERGLNIPGDIAVVGFDDLPWATSLQPPLTVVAQPGFEVGVTAARLLLDRLHDPARPPRHITLETRLIVRASCGAGTRQGGTPCT